MSDGFESEYEKREYEEWLASLSAEHKRIRKIQDELANQPEFETLVILAGSSRDKRDIQLVADYAVIWAHEHLK